jgi:hypothetical protein
MIAANYFVYLPGGIMRDDAKVRAMAQATGLGLYEAKVMIGAPGPRKVGAFGKEEEAQALALSLRQGGLNAFVVEKARFSRAPKIFKALKAVEDETGLLFSIETAPAPGEVHAQFFDLPQPKGHVRCVVLAAYTQTNVRDAGGKGLGGPSRTEVREPVIHLYSEDPHTILELRGPKFEWAGLKKLQGLMGDQRWIRMAELLAEYYQAKLDTTLFRTPAEVHAITAALNVDAAHGIAGKGGAASSDDSPVAMAASRIIVYSLVFGL